MSRYLILAQSEVTGKALGKWLELLGEPPLQPEDDGRLIITKDVAAFEGLKAVEAFETVLAKIEGCLSNGPSANMVILVDTVRPDRLNALSEGGWDHLLAMLILSFPEIHWHFGMISGYQPEKDTNQSAWDAWKIFQNELKKSWQQIEASHSLLALLSAPRRDSLFDPTGLRNFVRCKTNEKFLTAYVEKAAADKKIIDADLLKDAQKSLLPNREKTAASIDDEASYALFHAYTAYRFGYRADAVRSWALMEYLFGDKSGKSSHDYDLLFEDVNLNFPDKPGNKHLSTFALKSSDGKEDGRAANCPLLAANSSNEKSRFRIIVTSGHSGTNRNNMQDNIDFIKGYKEDNAFAFVLKPVGGMFDLWDKARLFKRLNPKRDPGNSGSKSGQAPGFYWPPLSSHDAEKSGGHSAPGKLMLIAQHLVRRADGQIEGANTVEECIRGAVLATDALEQLCFQTPTLALQALSLKHEFEVKSEVAFMGVGHHFLLPPRLSELERDVKVASRYFQKGRREAAELDTLVSIGNRLVLIFRKAGQFDEESACLIQVRKWHRKLQRKQSPNPLTLAGHWIMSYVEWLLVSPRRFVLAFVGWYLLFAGLWYVLQPFPFDINAMKDNPYFWYAMTASFNTFVAASPEKAVDATSFILNGLGMTTGIFHFGVFIAYLYSIISRK